MRYEEWRPAYEAILAAFGYGEAGDRRGRDALLAALGDGRPLTVEDLELSGIVAVCGAGPSLAEELSVPRRADAVVAASTAVDVLQEAGVAVDCMVTDLDKNPDTTRELAADGTPVAVHGHGDNVDAVRRVVTDLEPATVLPTTQTEPRPPVVNPGGFTDGDRAAFLADACGADRLVLAGWDLDDPSVGAEKARKLRWAGRLLYWLERRRGERFDPLDGRRDGLELPWR